MKPQAEDSERQAEQETPTEMDCLILIIESERRVS
jgi:hypothetical protein